MGKRKHKQNRTNAPKNEGGEEKVEDIVLQVYMHCQECANKVSRCLRGFHGVEEIKIDQANNKVIVKGEKAEAAVILERIRKKYSRNVQLISPKPKPGAAQGKEQPEKKQPQLKVVVLRMLMHCEGCARDIRKYIIRMTGVLSVEPDMGKSQVTVKGVFDPPKLAETVAKGLGKNVEIVKEEAVKNSKSNNKDNNKMDNEQKMIHYPPQLPLNQRNTVYHCQILSDENVHSCFIM